MNLGVGASGLNGLLLCDCSSFPGLECNEFKQPCSMADCWRTAGRCWSVLWYSFRIMTEKHPQVFFGRQVLWEMDVFQGWVAMSSHAGMLSLATGKESNLSRPKSRRPGAQQRRIARNSPAGRTYSLPGFSPGGGAGGDLVFLALNPGPPWRALFDSTVTPGGMDARLSRAACWQGLAVHSERHGDAHVLPFPFYTAQSLMRCGSRRSSMWCCGSSPSEESSGTPPAGTSRLTGCVTEMSLTY